MKTQGKVINKIFVVFPELNFSEIYSQEYNTNMKMTQQDEF